MKRPGDEDVYEDWDLPSDQEEYADDLDLDTCRKSKPKKEIIGYSDDEHDSDQPASKVKRVTEESGEESLDEDEDVYGEDATKVTPFNMKEEMEAGGWDAEGTYIQDKDPDADQDNWMQHLTKKDIQEAHNAHMKREAASVGVKTKSVPECYRLLSKHFEATPKARTVAELLSLKRVKRTDPSYPQSKAAIDEITEAASTIMDAEENYSVYEMTFLDCSSKLS